MAVILPHSAFIHVPKTGGTWCRIAIRKARLPHFESGPDNKLSHTHASIDEAHARIRMRNWRKGDKTKVKRFTFGFVRNPLTWLGSRWADALRKYGGVANHDISAWFKEAFDHDFPKFVDNVIRIQPDAPSIEMLGRLGYRKGLNDHWVSGEHVVDFVGRNESLVNDFFKAMRMAGEKINEKAIRSLARQRVASRLRRYKQQIKWTSDQAHAIWKANQQLCDRYGYEIWGTQWTS